MNSKTIEFSPERWARVERLFEEAAMLEPAERQAYLQLECGDDEPLCDYILALLQTDADHEATIQRTIVDTVSKAFGDDNAETDQMRGEMIGPYRIERLIGSGGMGMVYLAERDDEQFDQQVAIKLGRHRLIDPQTVLRLRHERQILANLDHPNIARLFDGGTTDDGVPYLVMEYIDGVRLDTYCDLNRLGVTERLRLFQTICSAVHYAHQNLVIHRDIKASNILVTSDGNPKLLDFGIAKLVDSGGVATDGLTREGAVIMTPANATPEQILGRAVTTATDVYALGLLLYNLLTGFRAYDTDDLAPNEFARVVCQGSVTRPSLRLEHEGSALTRSVEPDALQKFETLASNRATGVNRLQKQLRGDLDTIVLKALRKEPERRYRSASAFADDISLHSRSMPIVARSESWRYRAGKFARRHYAAVSASIGVVAMLIAFTVLLSVQNRNIAKQRDTAREVSQFLEEIFMAPDPAIARGVETTAEEILAAGAGRIQTDLRERPEIQATLMGTIGRVYYRLSEFQTSAEVLEQALQLSLQTKGESSPEVAAIKNNLAEVLVRLAEYDRAEELLQSSLAINQRTDNTLSPEIAKSHLNLAEVYLATGELELAKSSVTLSIDMYANLYAQLPQKYGLEYADAKNALARILQDRGDLDGIEDLFRESIEIVASTAGPDHPYIVFYMQNLGTLQYAKGNLSAAEKTLGTTVAEARRILGEEHDLVAGILLVQGMVLHDRGDHSNSERVIREVLALHSKIRGADHPLVGYDLTVLARLLHDMSDPEAAETALRRALEIHTAAALADDHRYFASALTELGAVLNTVGRAAEARLPLERALSIQVKTYASDHELVAATRAEYADTLTRLGFFDEAEPLLLESVDALSSKPGRRQRRAMEALARFDELSKRSNAEASHP